MPAPTLRLQATYGAVRSIWGDASGEIIALIDHDVLHYDGDVWSRLPAFRDLYPNDVWGSSPADLFAVGWNGYRGTIHHFDGIAWAEMWSGGGALQAVWGSGPNDVFAVGYNSTILHYDGVTWAPVETPPDLPSQYFGDVWGSSGSDVFVVGSKILHYNGSSWVVLRDTGGGVVWGSGDQVFVGQSWPRDGIVLHYDGFGWDTMETGTSQGFRAAWGNSPTDVFLMGDTSVLHWNGSTWSESLRMADLEPNGATLDCIWGRAGDDVFLGGDRFLHYDGERWSTVIGLIAPVWEVCVVSDTEFFTFGDDDTASYFDGTQWHRMNRTADDVNAAWGSSASDVFIVGTDDNDGDDDQDGYDDGHIQHYTGASWREWWWMPRGLNAIWGHSGSDVFAVGNGGIIVRYDGFSWNAMPSGTTTTLSAVWGSSGRDVFAAGRNGTEIEILHYDGVSWGLMHRHAVPLGYNRLRMWGSSNQDVYIGSQDLFLHYDGTSWKSVNAGATTAVWDIWGRSSTDVYVSGNQGILHYDGTTWTALGLDASLGWGGRIWGTDTALFTTGMGGVYRLGPE